MRKRGGAFRAFIHSLNAGVFALCPFQKKIGYVEMTSSPPRSSLPSLLGHCPFFPWACLEPALRGLHSSMSGRQSFFLLVLGCPHSSAKEAWKFPRLLHVQANFVAKENLCSEDVLALNLCALLELMTDFHGGLGQESLPGRFLRAYLCDDGHQHIWYWNEGKRLKVREWIRKTRGTRRRRRKSNTNSKEQIKESISIQAGDGSASVSQLALSEQTPLLSFCVCVVVGRPTNERDCSAVNLCCTF